MSAPVATVTPYRLHCTGRMFVGADTDTAVSLIKFYTTVISQLPAGTA